MNLKEFMKTCRIFGIPVLSFGSSDKLDYKRKQLKIFGIKIKYKNLNWLRHAAKYNLEQNIKNLSYEASKNNKNILFIASYFVEAGGIETRLLQYIKELEKFGWNVYLLSENNSNKKLKEYINFYLNFDSSNVQECLEKIIEKYNISCVEFQFKSSKILKNFDIKSLKRKTKLGCCLHNIGVKRIDKINKFDYKILVSGQMYQHHYKNILNPVIIKNSVNVSDFNNFPQWKYIGQKKAILISRIGMEKIESIECFIKYCIKNSIPFEIAGGEQYKNTLKDKLVKKFNLKRNVFIGQINTLEYLKENLDKYLFIAGVGQVILEGGIMGCPVFISSSYNKENYSFLTKENFDLFDNFTIKSYSPINKENKKELYLDLLNLEKYIIKDELVNKRSIDYCFKKYLEVIGAKYEK